MYLLFFNYILIKHYSNFWIYLLLYILITFLFIQNNYYNIIIIYNKFYKYCKIMACL